MLLQLGTIAVLREQAQLHLDVELFIGWQQTGCGRLRIGALSTSEMLITAGRNKRLDVGSAAASIQPHVDHQEQAGSF
jgi:hypothetical protein